MTVLYTGREPFNPAFPKDGLTWDEFKVWNGFTQMKELLSLDQFLNAEVNTIKRDADATFSIYDRGRRTGFYTSLDYVKSVAAETRRYNLLAVIKEPDESSEDLKLDDFEFVGYDLLDTAYGYSALSNLGSVLGPVKAEDLNEFGLIQHFSDVKLLQSEISNLYDGLEQADTYVMAIWRHLKIGRESKQPTEKLREISH